MSSPEVLLEYYDGESGYWLVTLPLEAVRACSKRGDVTEVCEAWAQRVTFGKLEHLRLALQRTGAYDADEMSLADVKTAVVWMAACDLAEELREAAEMLKYN